MSPCVPASHQQHGMSPGPPATPGSHCGMNQPSPGNMQPAPQMGMPSVPPSAGQMGMMPRPPSGGASNQGQMGGATGYNMQGQHPNLAVVPGGNMQQEQVGMMPQYPQYQNNMYPGHMMNQQQHCGNNQWQAPMNQAAGHPGNMTQPMYGPHQYFDHSGQPMQMMMPGKQERQSPLVQVPHISQSQIPARGKGRRQGPGDQGQEMHQDGSYPVGPQTGYMPQHPGAQGPMPHPPGQYGNGAYGPPVFPQQNPMYLPMLPPENYSRVPPVNHNMQQQGPHNMGHGAYNVPQNMPNHGNNPQAMQQQQQQQAQHHQHNTNAKMQMSPSCNQVSSTSDIKQTGQGQGPVQGHEHLGPEPNLNSISTDNLIDNLSSISMENLNPNLALSPTALCNRSTTSHSSRMTTPFLDASGKVSATPSVMDTSNMVVNDMSSMLSQLAEENAYLTMRR